MKKLICIMALTMALLPAFAIAQDTKNAAPEHAGKDVVSQIGQAGCQKFGIGASVTGATRFDNRTGKGGNRWDGDANITASYGYFFADGWEIGAEVTGTFTWDNYSGSNGFFGGVDGDITLTWYYITESKWIPYIGIKGGGGGASAAGSDYWVG